MSQQNGHNTRYIIKKSTNNIKQDIYIFLIPHSIIVIKEESQLESFRFKTFQFTKEKYKILCKIRAFTSTRHLEALLQYF